LAMVLIATGIIIPVVVAASQSSNMMGTSGESDCSDEAHGHDRMHGDDWSAHDKQMHGENWKNHMDRNMMHRQQRNNSCH